MFDRKDKSYDKNSLRTPIWLYCWLDDRYCFEVDLAADGDNSLCKTWIDEEENSLTERWRKFGTVGFCNPPYGPGKINPFLEKAVKEAKNGFTSVFVIPELNGESRTELIMKEAAKIMHFDKRVYFIHPLTGEPQKNNNRGTICIEFSEYKIPNTPAQHFFFKLDDVKKEGLEIIRRMT